MFILVVSFTCMVTSIGVEDKEKLLDGSWVLLIFYVQHNTPRIPFLVESTERWCIQITKKKMPIIYNFIRFFTDIGVLLTHNFQQLKEKKEKKKTISQNPFFIYMLMFSHSDF